MQLNRRNALQSLLAAPLSIGLPLNLLAAVNTERTQSGLVSIGSIRPDENLFEYIQRSVGKFDSQLYRQILGAANEFKEGDQSIGVAAIDDTSRQKARTLLSRTRLSDINTHSIFEDNLHHLLISRQAPLRIQGIEHPTLSDLKNSLLTQDEKTIKAFSRNLSSDVIACVVKLMSNDELISVGAKIYNQLPGSKIGAKGYLGARIQPNSPTDDIEDTRWQVFDGWSYAVGDVLLGTNPVSSEPSSVKAIELELKDLLHTFGLEDVMPHCVLSHIDVQAEVEESDPDSTALWFQSIAGTDSANQTFDISLEKMRDYARNRTGKYGLYFETGQGADFTNGHGHGFDMVLHESRKYGFARVLTEDVASGQKANGATPAPWVHLNDVAGFIGPEVFRTRDQLVRCCLEDIVMGKLHGLTIGLDVCSTLHMDISLEDLDWCLDQIMPANPAYLMALPTKIDPMLGYLTTGFQDHVRLREKFGYKVNDPMWTFYKELGVIDANGQPTEHFGSPLWVYLQYCRRKGDPRTNKEILKSGRDQLESVRKRGVFISEGSGDQPWELKPTLKADIQRIYSDAKESIWTELTPEFISSLPEVVSLRTRSAHREDYILHPVTGEQLSKQSETRVQQMRSKHAAKYDLQIVVSDGLNALAIMNDQQLQPFLDTITTHLKVAGFHAAPEPLIVNSGRVRAGYRIGEILFGGLPDQRTILHIIGERPGTGHHTFSVYITRTSGDAWGKTGKVDHNITKVVSGIAITALPPDKGATMTVKILEQMTKSSNS